ncbi:MAG: hypothetical protein OJF59_001843 [Cytophagales bacterium]|mgnify:CR=1 FL=1|jgi:hypothetical protein|nr:hypothetical protein [Bacteroidota bacterium]MBS1950688.1 hypothetical protein [Bacteroidota bacterium]MBS1980752.1 hypothetical protein [Bacteroidota bacterium]WHZ08090.1 MAG: hypothetical protein OJF59_001843 [Cytophagales bacterium]
MKMRFSLVVVFGLLSFSCSTPNDHSGLKDEISGTYVREYSFKVINQESGNEIGMRTIRDTIIVSPMDSEYKVTNIKWQLNHYDIQGWQNMKHSDNRPKPTFVGKLDLKSATIISKDGTELHWDSEKSVVFWSALDIYHRAID